MIGSKKPTRFLNFNNRTFAIWNNLTETTQGLEFHDKIEQQGKSQRNIFYLNDMLSPREKIKNSLTNKSAKDSFKESIMTESSTLAHFDSIQPVSNRLNEDDWSSKIEIDQIRLGKSNDRSLYKTKSRRIVNKNRISNKSPFIITKNDSKEFFSYNKPNNEIVIQKEMIINIGSLEDNLGLNNHVLKAPKYKKSQQHYSTYLKPKNTNNNYRSSFDNINKKIEKPKSEKERERIKKKQRSPKQRFRLGNDISPLRMSKKESSRMIHLNNSPIKIRKKIGIKESRISNLYNSKSPIPTYFENRRTQNHKIHHFQKSIEIKEKKKKRKNTKTFLNPSREEGKNLKFPKSYIQPKLRSRDLTANNSNQRFVRNFNDGLKESRSSGINRKLNNLPLISSTSINKRKLR